MKYFVRKSIAIMIALCAIFSMSLTAFASSTTSQYNNTIVLRTEEDWAKMRQHDLAEYNAKLANISPTLKKDVSTFLNSHNELAAMPHSKNSDVVSNEEFLTQFITAYPEYGHIRSELSADPFLDKMKTFANKSGTETLSDSSYTFDNGDLYWAIHGFTWTRSRTSKGTASFAIDDVYDFNKWKDIPGIVAGLAGTHDFDIHIEGLVQNGVIK